MVHWADRFLSFIVLCICEQKGSPNTTTNRTSGLHLSIYPHWASATMLSQEKSVRDETLQATTAKDIQRQGLPLLLLDCDRWRDDLLGSDHVLQEPQFLLNKYQWHFWDGALTSNWTLICLSMHVKNTGIWS